MNNTANHGRHPEIDYEKCSACEVCLNFCPMSVYTKMGGRIDVTYPDKCVDKCHGCEWRCPEEAISFPVPFTKKFAYAQYRYLVRHGRETGVLIEYLRRHAVLDDDEISAMENEAIIS